MKNIKAADCSDWHYRATRDELKAIIGGHLQMLGKHLEWGVPLTIADLLHPLRLVLELLRRGSDGT